MISLISGLSTFSKASGRTPYKIYHMFIIPGDCPTTCHISLAKFKRRLSAKLEDRINRYLGSTAETRIPWNAVSLTSVHYRKTELNKSLFCLQLIRQSKAIHVPACMAENSGQTSSNEMFFISPVTSRMRDICIFASRQQHKFCNCFLSSLLVQLCFVTMHSPCKTPYMELLFYFDSHAAV